MTAPGVGVKLRAMTVAPEELAKTLLRRASSRLASAERERTEAIEEVHHQVRALRSSFAFGRVWLIGSLPWGGFGLRSDIDLVLEGASEPTLIAIADAVGSATGRVVDALALEALPEGFAARVLAEGELVS